MTRREEYTASKNSKNTTLMKMDIGNQISKTPKKKTLKNQKMKKSIQSKEQRSPPKKNYTQRKFSRTRERNPKSRFSRIPRQLLDHLPRNPQQNNQPSMFTIQLWKFTSLETIP